MKTIITIILLFLIIGTSFAEEWETVPAKSEYFKDKYKKPDFHLGLNVLIGGAFYLNTEDAYTMPKYIFGLRLNAEKGYYELGFMMKFAILREYRDFTDNSTYYGERSKTSMTMMGGVNMKFPSALSFFESFKPYFLIGGGAVMDLTYYNVVQVGNNIYTNEIEGRGTILGLTLGTELELMKNLFDIDVGMNFLYNFDISQQVNYQEMSGEAYEVELDFYLGLCFNFL